VSAYILKAESGTELRRGYWFWL